MRWLGLVVLLAACGQDNFQAPNPGNLDKTPYDFSAMKYPRDLHIDEDAAAPDDGAVSDDGGSDAAIDMQEPVDLLQVEGHPDLTTR